MVIQGIVILSLLTTQALCAPTGCIECSSYVNQFRSQLSGISNHGNLAQSTSQLQGLDYSRPGTWAEHNDYNVNNGKVHEEKGQIVDGLKTVRYFKKNYTSSYGTRNPSGTGLSEIVQLNNNHKHGIYVPSSEDAFNSERTYNQLGNSESIAQQHEYNRIRSQQHTQSSVRRTNSQSERLEDFGEHNGNSQVSQQSASDLNTQVLQQPSYTNMQSGNSYKTDGGQGQVFEEEGRYVTGPKKVHYYKRKSSYSSSNSRFVPDIANVGEDNVHRDIENIHREIGVDHIHKDIENVQREIEKSYNQISTVQGITSSNTAQANINSNTDLNADTFHRSNSDVYKRRQDHKSNLSTMHHNEQQHHEDIASEYTPQQNPSQNTYDTSSSRTYARHEGYVLNPLPTSQYINPTSGYTNVLSTGNSAYNRNMYSEGNLLQQADNLHQVENLGEHQSSHRQNHMDLDNLRQNTYSQHSVLKPVAPSRVSHYKQQWSSSHKQETSLPNYSSGISQISGQSGQYNSQYRENFNTAHQTKSGNLMTGAMDLSHAGSNDDCTQGIVEQGHVSSQYHRIYKRSAKDDKLNNEQQHKYQSDDLTQQTEDLTQKTDNFKDLTQQTSTQSQFGHSRQYSKPPLFAWGPDPSEHWKPGSASQHSEDLTQQTGDFEDLTQQTTGHFQFGQQTEESHQPWRPGSASQHSEDLTQQTGDFVDLTQQTTRHLQFGQQTGKSDQPSRPGSASQHSEDLTQQTGDFEDLTQQTTGHLQFGQQTEGSHQPWRPGSASQHSEDLTQQTGDFEDLTQQTTGHLQFGQQTEESHQPWRPGSASQHSEDLTQQTGDFEDLTQQTTGHLQFGQQTEQSHQPWSDSQHSEDLAQQTGDFDDLTQQTTGHLQFGQQTGKSDQPSRPGSASQHPEDLTQQTGDFVDLTQQTTRHLQFGQQTGKSDQPSRPGSASQHSEDLTHQTGDFDDLTQQTTGHLQFGQQTGKSDQPSRPGSASQHSEDLTQQTGDFVDLTQQTTGHLQLGQQTEESHQPWRPGSASQHSEDLTQQTGDFEDLTQQTTGHLQFGQQTEGSHQPWRPGSASQHSEDLTQQTGDFEDLTQQTTGHLQFGQQTEGSHQPWRPGSASQHSEDLTQQTGDFEDLTQQTTGHLQLGQQTEESHQPWRPGSASQHSEDLTQQTGDFEDLTQQTTGHLQFGQQTEQSHQPWSDSQHSEDLAQQTGDFDDLSQQTSGKLQFGQQSHQPWRPGSASQHAEDLTQQTGDFEDLTQQTTGHLQFGQQTEESHQPWRPGSASQHSEDLTQQTGNFDDLTQQTTGHLQFGQQTEQSHQPWSASQDSEDMTKKNGHVLQVSDINGGTGQMFPKPLAKPASKPRPRPRYSRVGSVVNSSSRNHNVQNSNNEQPYQTTNPNPLLIEALNHSTNKSADRLSELPPKVVPGTEADGTRSQDIRGDQSVESSSNSDKTSTQKTEGLQWHYTYHPSDRRPLVQQADKKDKGDVQQQSTIPDFHDSNGNIDQQQAQDRYIFQDLYQQSSSPEKEVSGLHQQSQDGQEKVQLEFGQQTLGKTEDGLKQVGNNNPQHHFETRILEVYGGGPYDEFHDEDIYAGVTVNPSATLPEVNTADSWDIRTKPSEMHVPISEVTPPPSPVQPLSPDVNETTPPSTFWSRLGKKITNTIGKAKEKIKDALG